MHGQHSETAIFTEPTTLQQVFERVLGPQLGLLIYHMVTNGPEKQKFFDKLCSYDPSSSIPHEMMAVVKTGKAKLKIMLPIILSKTKNAIAEDNQTIADATRSKEAQVANAKTLVKGIICVKDDDLDDSILPSPEKLVLAVVTGDALIAENALMERPRICTYEYLRGLVTKNLVDFRTMSSGDIQDLFRVPDWEGIRKLAPIEVYGMIRALGFHGFKKNPEFLQNVGHYKELNVLSKKFPDYQVLNNGQHGLYTKQGLLAIYLCIVPDKYLDCSFEPQLNQSSPWFRRRNDPELVVSADRVVSSGVDEGSLETAHGS